MLMPATEILTVRTILTISATTVASAPAMSKSILSAVTLVVAIRSGILLRLPAARDECRKTADILSTFMSTLVRLRVGLLLLLLLMLLLVLRLMLLMLLLLVLRAILDLLITRRKRLRIARQIRLLLRLSRSVAWLVLTHKRLIVFFIPIEGVFASLRLAAARCAALLMRLLLVVVRVLLTKLFLRRSDQTKVVLGVLIIILGGHGVA